MEAVVFVGIQGSGKSTFYRERFLESHIRISLDMLRTRQREQVLLAACLQARQSFVVDNTNPVTTDRVRYIAPARAAGFRVVGYFFETSLRDAIRRNNQRSGRQRVPAPGVAGTFRKLEPPTLEEGFDALYVVTISADHGFAIREERRAKKTQDPTEQI
jgi:predicted kinase